VYRGHPVLITMFYSSCPATCPLLIDTLRATERELTPAQRDRLRVLLISIDPQRDTPEALRTLAEARHIDITRWTLARADAATVRTIAALLNVQYRQLPNGDFNHSTIITLLSPGGEIQASSATLGHPDAALLERLRR
jgi:protein SCO1/2